MRSGLRRLPGLARTAWMLTAMVGPSWCAPPAQSAPASIRFTYENPKLQPAKYVLTVQEDGSGHYVSEIGSAPPGEAANTAVGSQDRSIHISKTVRDEFFATARKNRFFAFACEARQKNIAFQGAKTLEYRGPDGNGSCQYNWSKTAPINKLTDELEAVAATLDEGSKLERAYEHERLSLDPELEFLTQMVQQGRATEVENIAPILDKLANDDAVLQRVQRRARALLQQAKTD